MHLPYLSSPRGNLRCESRFSSSLLSDENWYRKALMPWRMTYEEFASGIPRRTSMAKPFLIGRPAHHENSNMLNLSYNKSNKGFDGPYWVTSPHSQIPSVGCLYFHWRGGLELGPMGQLSHWFWWPWVGAIAIFPALLQTPLNTLTPLIPLHFSMFWPSGERLVYPQLTLCFCGLRYISFPEGRYLFAWVTNHDTNDSKYVTTWGN